MSRLEKPQAIFFDFDGVIVDSCAVKKDAFRMLFAGYPQEIVDQLMEYHRLHGGISRVEKIRWVHQELLGAPLGQEELDHWARRYAELVIDAVVTVPYISGALEFLQDWQKQAGGPLFIVSGTPEPELREIVRRRGLEQYFVEVLGSPIRKPEHIRCQLANYQLDPKRCLFIGDASTDHDAAIQTGLGFIGIQGDIVFPPQVKVLPDCRDLSQVLEFYGE